MHNHLQQIKTTLCFKATHTAAYNLSFKTSLPPHKMKTTYESNLYSGPTTVLSNPGKYTSTMVYINLYPTEETALVTHSSARLP